MKKLFIALFVLIMGSLLMVYFVAEIAEKEIKSIFSASQSRDVSVKLISYQRNFFTATAISEVTILTDQASNLSFNINTDIVHYPYQAVLKNVMKITDKAMAKKAKSYFVKSQWISSIERINIFSQLSGQLTVAAGKYEGEKETLTSEPVVVDYQIDLKNQTADFKLNWAGLTGTTNGTLFNIDTLQLASHVGELSTSSNYDYQLQINTIEVQQNNSHSVLQGLVLNGSSQQGVLQQTIDTTNELIVHSYKINTGVTQAFTNNRLKFALTGLYQPAFELLNTGSDDTQEIENAFVELVNHGAQLTLSQLGSTTPWGEVDGSFDLVLDQGASLSDIMINPYILFDYMSGNARLVLPLSLLDEPALTEPLQMGLMTGFLEKNAQTLNLKSSFQQGELIVNGRVIPL